MIKFYSTKEAAEMTQVTEKTVKQWIRDGRVRHVYYLDEHGRELALIPGSEIEIIKERKKKC